jgi:chitin disaccharide deacetylase
MAKHVIFNADDFGFAKSVNRGIVKCHTDGVVTSTSLMVTGREADEAVAMSRDLPDLAIGLHWDVWGEDEREFDLADHQAIRREFSAQLDEFERLMGRLPTHIDSHRHAHRQEGVFDLFRELVEPLNIPLRDDGRVRFVGHFYGQWEWKVTNLDYISVSGLQRWLRDEVQDGWTELSCHPAYVSDDWDAVYKSEREVELITLTDPRIRETLNELDIVLKSYADVPREKI